MERNPKNDARNVNGRPTALCLILSAQLSYDIAGAVNAIYSTTVPLIEKITRMKS